jgi:hypothetical protein
MGMRRVPAPQYLIVYAQTYRCIIRDMSGTKTGGEGTLVKATVTKTVTPTPVQDNWYKVE